MRVASLLPGLILLGCVDPEGEYEAFRDRLDDEPVVSDDSGVPSADAAACSLADLPGEYVLALSVSLSPGTPIVSSVVLEATESPPTVTFASIQPLGALDRATPAGDPFSAGPFEIVSGHVVAVVPGLRVVGAANPISGGDIAADATLGFDVCAPDGVICGDVTGSVTDPLPVDLVGSTFTLSRAADVTADLPIDCAGTLANPL